MNADLKKSLDRLHEKQDGQSADISALKVAVGKQEAQMDAYVKQSDRMATELGRINENLAVYNAELKVHVAGVMELREQNRLMREENNQRAEQLRLEQSKRDAEITSRLDIAEKPIIWLRTTWRVLKAVGPIVAAVATAIVFVLQVLGVIKL